MRFSRVVILVSAAFAEVAADSFFHMGSESETQTLRNSTDLGAEQQALARQESGGRDSKTDEGSRVLSADDDQAGDIDDLDDNEGAEDQDHDDAEEAHDDADDASGSAGIGTLSSVGALLIVRKGQ
mmetsp:Transcript_31367/g.68720  ORF Transcript_31367/g.68720 Transcript_31367/m.68720 type:complete len:126 (-) Transcript_31367:365-742(-)|eukprot:CAMPEP_0204265826 /NCGR_PEP_ID=MMETSP0468-20130131/9926_1 /ASSEMBLY_ACC=CAM_ASM_000383 /TAXON_ID=2969 /ORGANISM="Oxyrrhis marina" /LENGTH=125 /DNA_ID=CAMNT_0051240819 /DNA_START=63 /DNA_END=440 /DNA_ORIENTATION=+